MDLEEFTQLTLDTPNAAKNFLSFMLGYKFPDEVKSEKALRTLFYSFPQSFRNEKKLFEPIIEKFFKRYPVNKDNIELFNTYITKQEVQTFIKEKNPDWAWEDKPLEFKNFTAYLASFNATVTAVKTPEDKLENAHKFVDNNSEALHKFILQNKNKVEMEGIKKEFFLFFIKEDLSKFNAICEQYGFNIFNILDSHYGSKSYYGLGGYLFSTSHKDLSVNDYKLFFDNVLKNPELLLDNNRFIKGKSISYDDSKFELPYYFCSAINNKEYDKAAFFMEYFNKDLVYLLNKLSDNIKEADHKNPNETLKYPEITEELLEIFADKVDYSRRRGLGICPYNFTKSDAKDFFNYINIIRHYEKLDQNLPLKSNNTNKNKI